MIRIAKLALVALLCAAAPSKSPLVAPVFERVTNLVLQSNAQQEAVWEKEATVVASGNEPTCPLDPETGARMAIVSSGTTGNGIKQDAASTPARSLYLAYPSDPGTACGLTISDYSGDGPASYAATASAVKISAYGLGETGIKVVGAGTTINSVEGPGGTVEAVISGDYLYAVRYFPDQTMYMYTYNISGALPVLTASKTHFTHFEINQQTSGMGVIKDGNYLYASALGGTRLGVYDVSNPAAITQVETVDGAWDNDWGKGPGLIKVGNYVYVGSSTLDTYNATNPLSIAAPARLNLGGASYSGIVYKAPYLYVNGRETNQLYIVDITNGAAPSLVGAITLGGTATFSVISGDYLYAVITSTDKLEAYSLAAPTTPTKVGEAVIGDDPRNAYVSGSVVYVVSPPIQISAVDVTTPASMSVLYTGVVAGTQSGLHLNYIRSAGLAATGSNLFVSANGTLDWFPLGSLVTACGSWCMSSVQLENRTAASANFCGPTVGTAKSCKIYH